MSKDLAGISTRLVASVPPERGVYCNRTLNLRGISAIGYDMDYTLVHYKVEVWEEHAFEDAKQRFLAAGWPVEKLKFDRDQFVRGLIVDTELGNVVKANRFGYVIQATHGTKPMEREALRNTYAGTVVELREERYQSITTLFSLSEASLYTQLVDLLDERRLPEVLGYPELFRRVQETLDETHIEGELKRHIIADPERFIERDSEVPLTLLDQQRSGKRLVLITNSEWSYTKAMMDYAFNPYLADGTTWEDLFSLVIAGARKPGFFSGPAPMFEVVDRDEELLRPAFGKKPSGKVFWGGNAAFVEAYLDVSGGEILYVGDHILSDVQFSKRLLRWRTALVLRELEEEIRATEAFAARQKELVRLMARKQQLEQAYCALRLHLQRSEQKYAQEKGFPKRQSKALLAEVRSDLEKIDQEISPLAQESSTVSNANWGPLMRSGNDKSYFARQIENFADIYMSRVSNFLHVTPYAYLRASRGSLPHDPEFRVDGSGKDPDNYE